MSSIPTALIATAHVPSRLALQQHLEGRYRIVSVSSWSDLLEIFRKRRCEYTFLDINVLLEAFSEAPKRSRDFKPALEALWKEFPSASIIVMGEHPQMRRIVLSVRGGADDYLLLPVEPSEVDLVLEGIQRQALMAGELEELRMQSWKPESYGIRTRSPSMKQVLQRVRQVAPTMMNVLIQGETGTGKGVLARLIHKQSARADKTFIHVHCGAIPDTLLESELFGHEKGAFTHAIQRKLGKFELAQGGTIFLDEIGTMSSAAQIKLLQVLQDKIFQRVGGFSDIQADVRVVAASNLSLKALCETGQFRSDLYYRLNVFSVTVPPLRERKEDVPLLSEALLQRFNQNHPKMLRGLHPDVLEIFRRYDWPGNIRELENVLERAYVLETDTLLRPESLPEDLLYLDQDVVSTPVDTSLKLALAREQAVEAFEREYLSRLLEEHRGHIARSAESAGITPRQLHRMLAKYQIRRDAYKISKNSLPFSADFPLQDSGV
jgi:DNA-binding NtrC family response regulator